MYTTTHVMPSRHVQTALLHIHTILLLHNLSVEIGLQPTHKFLQNTTNTLHIPLLCAHEYTHTIWPISRQNHAMTIHQVPRIQWADITYLNDITVSAETK